MKILKKHFSEVFSPSKKGNEKYYFITYNISDIRLLKELHDSKKECHIFVNSKFYENIVELKNKYSSLHFYHSPNIHIKLYLCSNGKVVTGSQNMNISDWKELMIEFNGKKYYETFKMYVKDIMEESSIIYSTKDKLLAVDI